MIKHKITEVTRTAPTEQQLVTVAEQVEKYNLMDEVLH